MEKFNKKVKADLLEGEEVLAATKAAPKGVLEGAILSSATYVAVGAMAATAEFGKEAREKGEQERKSAGLDLGKHNQIIVGITPKRLLIWSTKWYGAPKKLLGAVVLSDIQSIERVNSKLLVANMPALKITLKDDNFFELQVAKIHIKKGEQIVEEFEQAQ